MPTFTASTPLWQFHLLRSPSFFFAMCKHCLQGPANQIPKICEFYLGAYMTIYPDTCFLKITYASYVCTLYALAYVINYQTQLSICGILPRTSSSATGCRRSSGCARPAALFQQAAVTRRGLSQHHPVYQDGTVTSSKPREIRSNK